MRRRAQTFAVLWCVASVLAGVFAAEPAAANGHEGGSAAVDGGIERLVIRSQRTRVSGWISGPAGRAPAVRITIDGRVVRRFRPTQRRYDVAATLPAGQAAWAWDVTIERPIASSLCVSALDAGKRRGIECWSRGTQEMLAAIGGGPRLGTTGPLIRYSVETEAATGVHPEELARTVDAVLADPRSWAANGDARFKRVTPTRADLRIVLATPATTDRLCFPFLTGGQLSCNLEDRLIVLNINRWRSAVPHWSAPIAEYHAYLVNHEVGHSLEFRHVGCPGPGRLAPLMMQQTKSLGGCRPNGWPYP